MPTGDYGQGFTSYADAARRASGFLVAWDAKILLRFQINPASLQITKNTSWTNRQVPGWEAPIHWWQYGGDKTVKFDLFFDSTDSASSGGISLFNPALPVAFGLQGVIAVLESFVYPRKGYESLFSISGIKDIPKAVLDLAVGPEAFTPPPEVYFVYGLRIWKGHIGQGTQGVVIDEVKHDRMLNPTQITCSITLTVHEEGTLHKIDTAKRNGFALLSSGSAAVESTFDILSDLGGAIF